MLTRDQMLERSKQKVEKVQVEAWGESVFMRGMTGAERNSLSFFAKDEKSTGKKFIIDPIKYNLGLIARCLCDSDGKRLFADDETDLVGQFPGEVLDVLFAGGQKLSGMDDGKNS